MGTRVPNDLPLFDDSLMFQAAPRGSAGGRELASTVLRARPAVQHENSGQSDLIEIASTRAAFDALEAEWIALFARAGSGHHVFQTFNWNWHWANHYLDAGDDLAVTTVRRNGRLIMIWPLVVTRRLGVRCLAWMGDPVSQYGDCLADAVPDLMALMRRAFDQAVFLSSADVVELRKVRADATVAPLLVERGLRVTGTEEAPYADLAAAKTTEQFEQRFNAKAKKNRGRQRRRLEERGPLLCTTSTGGSAAREGVIACMTLKRAWLQSKGLVSRALADRRVEAFFADAAASAAKPCGVSVSAFRSAGEIADINIAVTAKNTRALHMIAYGLKFEKAAPGALHLEDVFRTAFADGIARVDFLCPRHPYKMDWCDGTVEVRDYVHAVTARGRASVAIRIGLLRNGSKALLARLPENVRQKIATVHRAIAARRG
jgi:CelD/BcsL family acetyltransferase involved in cellulose biosynthesis